MSARGQHKVFIGMAPGVGKTYQMLEEAREEHSRGRDVVIGYLEPHGRAETLAQAEGLETIARRRVHYRGKEFEEMDLPAIVGRRPQLCVIDELAHTNVPGCEHEKRYQDVAAVLDAGIDVYSTVNVQHVQSLADEVTAMTGVRVGETLPDSVLDEADAVVLVDITPELLIERLAAGKIYPGQSPAAAQMGFFRPQRLVALRELSLRHVAQEVEAQTKLAAGGVELATRPGPRSRERLLALATPEPRLRPVVHRASRIALRLDAPLDVLWVHTEPEQAAAVTSADDRAVLARLVSALGGTLLVRDGRGLAITASEVASERGATCVVIGRPQRRSPLGLLVHRRLPLQLIRAMPSVDVQIVALPNHRRTAGEA